MSNPEFTAEGRAVSDFMNPDRIVIGADDPAAGALVAELHAGLGAPVVTMDVRSAEMRKLASNALLATRINFANEIATLCENTGVDAMEVLGGVGLDHRLGPHDPVREPGRGDGRCGRGGRGHGVAAAEGRRLGAGGRGDAAAGALRRTNLLDPFRKREIGFTSMSVGRP